MINKRVQRKKAFLGAIVGGLMGIAGSAISGAMQKKAAEKQARQQRIDQNNKTTYESAQNLTNAYSDEDWADDLRNRVTFKKGGKMKTSKFNSNDRIVIEKKLKCGGKKKAACGGRKKAENGTEINTNTNSNFWNNQDTSDIISAGFNSLGNIIGTNTKTKADTYVAPTYSNNTTNNRAIKPTSYSSLSAPVVADNRFTDRIQQYKCGGVKRKKCGGKAR